MNKVINIVWLKRDLRLRDHPALNAAAKADGPTLLLYCFEASIAACPQHSLRHWRFAYESIQDLNQQLKPFNQQVFYLYQEVIPTLEKLSEEYQINSIFAHEEVGIKATFDRDKAVAKWCQRKQITFKEFPQNGTIRGRKHRRAWLKNLEDNYLKKPPIKVEVKNISPVSLKPNLIAFFEAHPIPISYTQYKEGFQKGGETRAWRYFKSFLEGRCAQFSKHISKPALSRLSCSRLSPYIAFGCLSEREVYQFSKRHPNSSKYKWPLDNFRTRLWWRPHFIQKLETEWRIEQEPINPAFAELDRAKSGVKLDAWKQGKTGYPMVDACMRCLEQNGWINFRMRAMLVSFATFSLWLDWKPVSNHLAQLFLDFDPGIHYPQIQMQAGLTAFHTLRIYNPMQQVEKHDAEGLFIQKWLPELENIPVEHLAAPWKMTAMEQGLYQCEIGKDYPAPIVAFEETQKNKDRYWKLRQGIAAQKAIPSLLRKYCIPSKDKKVK